MRNLLRLIYRYYFLLLFLLIEFFCFFLVIQYNSFQKSSFLNSSNYISGVIYEGFDDISKYMSLREINKKLSDENAKLRNLLKKNHKYIGVRKWEISDSIFQKKYIYRSAKVLNNSVNKQYNYLTLNKGLKQGIYPEMAVVTQKGVIGIIKDVSNNYSTVISIINGNLKISAKIKKNGYFGSISWNRKDYRFCDLNEIPCHVNVAIGDTVVTSGYSSIFPEGIPIGKVSYLHKDESSSFYEIQIELLNDMNQVAFVYIIENKLKNEIEKIEQLAND